MNLYLDLKELEIDKEIDTCIRVLTELIRERTRDHIKRNLDKESAPCRIFEYTVSFDGGEYPADILLRGGTGFTGEFITFDVHYLSKDSKERSKDNYED